MNFRMWVVGLAVLGGSGAAAAQSGSDFRTSPPSSMGTSFGTTAGAPRTSPTGRVVQGDGLEDAALSRVVKANKAALEACLARATHRDPSAEGRIHVTFEIAPDGATREVVAEDAVLRDALVDACLVDQVKGWTFPKPSDGKPVQVRLPVAVGTQLQALPAPAPDPVQPPGPPVCIAKDVRAGEPRRPVLAGPDGAPDVKGGLDPAEVRKGVARIRHRINACYERALKSDPALTLRLSVGFTVGTSGKVTEVKLESPTPPPPELASCLTAAITSLAFAPPDNVVIVRYPFTFGPSAPEPGSGAPTK